MVSSFVDDFGFEIAERMETATAEVITNAIARASQDGGTCTNEIIPCVRTGECARRNRACRGPGIDGVLPCCDSNYNCVRRDEEVSRCRRVGTSIPSFYEGTIEPPTVCIPVE